MPSAELDHAIDHTLLSRLQSLLKQVCDASPEARALVEEELLAAESTTVIDLTDDDDIPTQATNGVKRSRYAICEQCKEEFDITENDDEACQHHTGELEVDWDGDFWADHDEEIHGTIDLDLADEYPQGFMWECCNELGDSEGCETGPHIADESFKPEAKKRRVWE
ncbi:hypothetical protein AUEXF2481DRAFT_27499 [Aureobasidium subglaciale EXF-2481]|uniref:C2H2-type domain-containing protein n=1 Tax=Aureobasidium subglaciale (strain EXF-2481) TaxID=1043005 RepID=A0A074YHQ7_AURSE|nr:uncharacterized protein AUEXF2481DRAFT_27499 [Aureobasidium subglaciale EXF-2481]KEQ97235.1 hypothetical protein AUEXF2481DRAFT_27499 [Aureobasidium subglaciale EXF-2481]